MRIGTLDHVNVQTARLAEMVAWYDRVLGMPAGWRPQFPFPGAWLYSGDQKPTVHLVGVAMEPPGGLKLEHFAFSATGLESFVGRLEREGVRYDLIRVRDAGLLQVNVLDPDGNHIHIDFKEHEAASVPAAKIREFTGLPGMT